MKLRRLLIAVTFGLAPAILGAQEVSIGEQQDKPVEERIVYKRENVAFVTLHTQGLGAGYKIGKVRSIYKVTNWNFECSYIRSLKQIKLYNGSYWGSSSFVYGKLNDVASLRAGYGVERRIYGKPYWGGVELRWLYGAGAEVALLKPYYYSVVVAEPTSTGTYIQKSKYDTFDHIDEWIEILGRAPFKYGLNEIKFRPGIFAKGGLEFEIGTSRTHVQSLEAGVVVEYFPQGLQLMALNPASYVIPTLYLSYRWGSRFNKY